MPDIAKAFMIDDAKVPPGHTFFSWEYRCEGLAKEDKSKNYQSDDPSEDTTAEGTPTESEHSAAPATSNARPRASRRSRRLRRCRQGRKYPNPLPAWRGAKSFPVRARI